MIFFSTRTWFFLSLTLFSVFLPKKAFPDSKCSQETFEQRVDGRDGFICFVDMFPKEAFKSKGLLDVPGGELLYTAIHQARPCADSPQIIEYKNLLKDTFKILPPYMKSWARRVDKIFIEGPKGYQSNASSFRMSQSVHNYLAEKERVDEILELVAKSSLTEEEFKKISGIAQTVSELIKHDQRTTRSKKQLRRNAFYTTGLNERIFQYALGAETRDLALNSFLSFYHQFRLGSLFPENLGIGASNKYVYDENGPKAAVDLVKGVTQAQAIVAKSLVHEAAHDILFAVGAITLDETVTKEINPFAEIDWIPNETENGLVYTSKNPATEDFQEFLCANPANKIGSIVSDGKGVGHQCSVPNVGFEIRTVGDIAKSLQMVFESLDRSHLWNWLAALNPEEDFCETLANGLLVDWANSYEVTYQKETGEEVIMDMIDRSKKGKIMPAKYKISKRLAYRAALVFEKGRRKGCNGNRGLGAMEGL